MKRSPSRQFISNVNNIPLIQVKPKRGFANPWLYPEEFKVILPYYLGQSIGCADVDSHIGQTASRVADASWEAARGWDPATGQGIPDSGRSREMLATTGG